jgi:hypothetical protein
MAISYSAITNYGRVTLPSVEGGLGCMNILRDPPKSITTRRIDKVGETSSITELIDESGDRACEAISLYARGVNPMVSVSYGNAGNNGGQRPMGCGSSDVGSSGNNLHSAQAFLPYRVARDGAFRPPIISQQQLLPLSRQPRTNTKAFSQPCFADFSKKLICPGGYNGTKQELLKACVQPTATYHIGQPLVEPFEVKYVIKNPVKFDPQAGNSNMRTRDLTMQDVLEPTKGIAEVAFNVTDVYTNQSGENMKFADNSHLDTSMNIKDAINIEYTAPFSGNTKENFIQTDIELRKNILEGSLYTNKSQNIYSRPQFEHQKEQKRNRPIGRAFANHGVPGRQTSQDIGSRDYKLKETINAGQFDGRGQIPMKDRMQYVDENVDFDKRKMRQKIMDMQLNRR